MDLLLHSAAEVLQKYFIGLTAAGISASNTQPPPLWPAYIEDLPEQFDQAVVFTNYEGTTDGRLMRGETIKHPAVQIRTRSPSRPDAYQKAAKLASLLDDIHDAAVTINGTGYIIQNTSGNSQVMSMGVDKEKRRYNYSVNTRLTIRMA